MEENKFTKALVDLIKENPELPVITMVDTEIVHDDSYGRWYSSIGNCRVDEYVIYEKSYSEANVIFKSDIDEIEEDLLERDDDLTEEKAKTMALALDWKKAIFLSIDIASDMWEVSLDK